VRGVRGVLGVRGVEGELMAYINPIRIRMK